MDHRLLLPFLLLLLSAALSSAKTFNITKELEAHPSLSEFNDALTESGLAKSINARRSVTVCALTNSQMDTLKANLGADASDIKKVAAFLRPLILLTFIDPTNPHTARAIKRSGQPVSTMYQAAGTALEGQGVANLTKTKKGSLQIVAYGGSNTTITKTVKLIGFDLSIVQVTNYLSPDGIVESENRPVVPDAPPAPPPPPKSHKHAPPPESHKRAPPPHPRVDSSTAGSDDSSSDDSTDDEESDSKSKPNGGVRILPALLGAAGSALGLILLL